MPGGPAIRSTNSPFFWRVAPTTLFVHLVKASAFHMLRVAIKLLPYADAAPCGGVVSEPSGHRPSDKSRPQPGCKVVR